MNALILAAGLGTRLRPLTENCPKALVKVGEIPMLQRVINRLVEDGAGRICVNVHHLSHMIVDFLRDKDFGCRVIISDESQRLLDTGGGILQAFSLLGDDAPMLVHNVDIISNADLVGLYAWHVRSGNDVTLLVSRRDSSRRLVFDEKMNLLGRHELKSGKFTPPGLSLRPGFEEYAFSGIYVIGKKAVEEMRELNGEGCFPVMDYLLSPFRHGKVRGYVCEDLKLVDIGKPETLALACGLNR